MTKLSQFNNEEFHPRTFVVDPAGCGCTDCLLGYSTPADELGDDQIIAAIQQGFRLMDRRNAHEKITDVPKFPISIPVDPVWVRLLLSRKS